MQLRKDLNMDGNRISDANFYVAFHSNYGLIVLSFRDMITGRTDDGPILASIVGLYLALNTGQQVGLRYHEIIVSGNTVVY